MGKEKQQVMAELWAGPLDGGSAPLRPHMKGPQPVIDKRTGALYFYTLITDPEIDNNHYATFHHNDKFGTHGER